MKRRNFLKIAPPAAVTPFVLNGFSMRPFANSKMASVLNSCEGVQERTLVLIQMKGGNDGINMVVPINQYDRYAEIRPTIRINEGELIPLDTTLPNEDQVGLHPSMTGIKALYDNGWAAIVQATGYQSMNQSHFKGTDLWLSGGGGYSDLNNVGTGWMGRSLQALYPEVQGLPTPEMPDPLGIQIGDPNTSLGFHTETEHQNALNLTGQDASGFYSLVQTIGGAPISNVPATDHGDELNYIMGVENTISQYASRITQVFNAGTNAITYPNTSLANQLKTVARLVRGGCKTKIYLCQIGGFDLHSNQVVSGNTGGVLNSNHAALLKTLSDAVKAFCDDLDAMGMADRVMACTFSEFGRCAAENGTLGTDHGTLAPMMVFGKAVRPKVHGTNVNLEDLTGDNQVKNMQFDYRQVFGTLLQDWLGANPYVLQEAFFYEHDKIFMLEKKYTADSDCYWGGTPIVEDPFKPVSVFPNPASISAEVAYESKRAFSARLSLHSLGGEVVSASTEQVQVGENFFYLNVASLPTGTYFVRMEDKSTGRADVTKLQVVR
jgi:uncharacterized protein (DUF1501 family)